METFEKFSSIPIVESGIHSGLRMYNRFKRTNRLVNWSLETSENIALSMFESVSPALRFIEGPLEKLDKIGLKVLEQVEERAPNLYLPPQMLYWNTKEYVSDHVVKPVLKRADSFGDIVDGAIDKADNALDKFLPDKDSLNNCEEESHDDCIQRNHAVRTILRSRRLSKKFRKKIRSRTVAEVKALKEDVHILIYVAELIVTNPKEAHQKFNELWCYLSANEPENQKRPETLEELFVLIMRETARKIVHLINFTTKHLSKIPKRVRSSAIEFLHHVLYFTDSFLKVKNIVKQRSARKL
jgi:perilipin-2